MQANHQNNQLPIAQVLLCGAMVVTLAMGIRHGFGLWLQPITQAQNWSRETFSFAIAIQNLSWGFFGIFAGMVDQNPLIHQRQPTNHQTMNQQRATNSRSFNLTF